MDKDGVLSMHYDGQVKRIPMNENVGKKVALGEGGIAVEIEKYLPNARPEYRGKRIVTILGSLGERYLSTPLFSDLLR